VGKWAHKRRPLSPRQIYRQIIITITSVEQGARCAEKEELWKGVVSKEYWEWNEGIQMMDSLRFCGLMARLGGARDQHC